MIRRLGRLGRDGRGVSAMEFAIVATPLFLVLLGLFDLALRQYMASMLHGVMDQAARRVTVGGVTEATITSFVDTRMKKVLAGSTTVVTPLSYANFSKVKRPEPIAPDGGTRGVVDPGDCFLDLNNNGVWDADAGAAGYGTGDDIVYYTAVSRYPAIMPMRALMGWGDIEQVSATMMMRNQPFAGQAQPATICK